MTQEISTIPRGVLAAFRFAEKILPLQTRYLHIIQKCFKKGEYISVESDGLNVIIPETWFVHFSPVILGGVEAGVPDFRLVHGLISSLTDGVILDVGANMGMWSMLASKTSELEIIAFEPEPANFENLSRNIKVNQIKSIKLVNMACSHENSSIPFHLGLNGWAMLPEKDIFNKKDPEIINVESVTIDSQFEEQKVSFIKIDVEGYEGYVIKGAEATIRKWKPILCVEIHAEALRNRQQSPQDILNSLKTYYSNIELYIPRHYLRGRLGRFVDRYRSSHHIPISESEFTTFVQGNHPPGQVHAICRP